MEGKKTCLITEEIRYSEILTAWLKKKIIHIPVVSFWKIHIQSCDLIELSENNQQLCNEAAKLREAAKLSIDYIMYLHLKSANYLVPISMTSYDNTLGPAWYQSWNVVTDYGFSENCSTKNVSDCAIGRSPHLLQFKF